MYAMTAVRIMSLAELGKLLFDRAKSFKRRRILLIVVRGW